MKLTEFIGITSRNMHVKFEAVWRSFNFWQKNADSARTLEKGWNFDIFSKFSEIHETYRIYWNHLQEHVCEIWSSLEKFQFLTESCQQCRTLKRMKFWHFLKVLQNSWNLQNLLESPPGTCMWNLKQFGEVSIFDRKMPTAPDLRKRMKFWHFLKVLRNSWNLQNILESPPGTCIEIWSSLKFQFLTEKCLPGWNFDILSKFIHETYRIYWNHWNMKYSSLEKFQFLTEKCRQRRTLEKGWTLTFSQSSPKFMKLTEFIGLTSRNMHVKFGAV